jgi:hypothetical protein
MSKRPAFQFYPGDWRTDPGLRLCSVTARGLWIEMMCLMHEGEPYGHLTVQGRPIAADMLARLSGEALNTVKRGLAELEANEVFSLTDAGVIFSRRMVRDESIREARATGGKDGASHGHKGGSYGSKGGRPKKQETPHAGDIRGVILPPPSSSSSSPSPVEGSVDKSTAPDPEKIMFDSGVNMLVGIGKSHDTARSLLGKWKRDHGAAAVIEALGAAQREGAINPVSFIEGRWRQRTRELADAPLC